MIVEDTDFVGYNRENKKWELVPNEMVPDIGGPWYAIEISRYKNWGYDKWVKHLQEKSWFDIVDFNNCVNKL